MSVVPFSAGGLVETSLQAWRMIVGPWKTLTGVSARDGIELTQATRRRFTWDVELPPSCSFIIPAESQEAEYCWELTHDVILYDEASRPIFRGRMGTVRETYDLDRAELEVQATGYAGMLGRSFIYHTDQLTYTQWEQVDLAWDMINTAQNRPNGNLGITRGITPNTGRKRDRTYLGGESHLDVITNLGEVIDGFDWEISGDLKFNTFYPYRAKVNPVVLDWGGMVAAVSRSWTSTVFANVVRGQGGILRVEREPPLEDIVTPTVPVVRSASNIATAPEGRWETNLSWPDVLHQTTLVEHTEGELKRRNQRLADITVNLRPGMWEGPEQIWIGDIASLISPLRSRTGELGLSKRTVRIMSVNLELGDDGSADVSLVVTEDYEAPTGLMQAMQQPEEFIITLGGNGDG